MVRRTARIYQKSKKPHLAALKNQGTWDGAFTDARGGYADTSALLYTDSKICIDTIII